MRLRKGLLLLDRGQELAEEAVGFGVPVLKKGLQAIFPGDFVLTWQRNGSTWEVTVLYKLNLVEKLSRSGIETVESRPLYAIKNILAAAIRNSPLLRGLLTAISSLLRRTFHWETTYTQADVSADVKVTYIVEEEAGKVTVEIDASALPPDVTEVVVMNELGAHVFDRYLDSSGFSLAGEQIGCWDEVYAGEACFESSLRRVAFRLGRVKGARLFRGRELVQSRLAWAGFGYSFPPSMQRLRYEMKIERVA